MAANGKSILIDTTKCFACRSCQVACKQWNDLPAEAEVPTNRGTYENPPNLSHTQWLLIHFKEAVRENGELAWNFVRNSCRHCIDAPCRQAAENKNAIVIDEETGAVLFTEETKNESFEKILRACPFGIPRQDPETGQLFKCVMCVDRVDNEALDPADRITACAKACPSDAIEFGDRDEILAMGEARVAALSEEFPQARLLDKRDVRLVILVTDPADAYKLTVA